MQNRYNISGPCIDYVDYIDSRTTLTFAVQGTLMSIERGYFVNFDSLRTL